MMSEIAIDDAGGLQSGRPFCLRATDIQTMLVNPVRKALRVRYSPGFVEEPC
jgi:hypothetical protein